MNNNHLGIIPCTKNKIWDTLPNIGPTLAACAYSGPEFILAKQCVSKVADRIVIFSAKYGFLDLADTIPEFYDVTFSRKEDPYIDLSRLQQQAEQKGLLNYKHITAICNVHYQRRISAIFSYPEIMINFPVEGLMEEEEICLKLNKLILGNYPQQALVTEEKAPLLTSAPSSKMLLTIH